MASSASRRKAMLQPGMCSATWSLSRTCVGWPGEAATQAAGRLQADVAGDAQAAVGLMDGADVGEALQDGPRVVGRAVVHDDHFVVRVVERPQGAQALLQRPTTVVGA